MRRRRTPTQAEQEAFSARQATLAVAVLLCLSEGGFALVQRTVWPTSLSWMYVAHSLLSGLVALVLLSRRALSPRWSLAAYCMLVVPLLPMFWLSESAALAAGRLWQPFIGRKLILLGLAMLTPHSKIAAIVLVSLFMGESAAVWTRLDLAHEPLAMAAGEPWVTLIFFAASVLVVLQRWHYGRLERRLLDTHGEAETLRQLVLVSLTVRDQVNTPLQTLEMSIALLRMRHPEEDRALDRMERSLRTLVELSRSLDLPVDAERLTWLREAREAGARLEGLEPSPDAPSPPSARWHPWRRAQTSRHGPG